MIKKSSSMNFLVQFQSYVGPIKFNPNKFTHELFWTSDVRKGNMCVKVSDTVLPPITGLCITFGTYMEALGTGR